MGAGVFVDAQLKEIELVFLVVELLFAEELLLAEEGGRVLRQLVREVGDGCGRGGKGGCHGCAGGQHGRGGAARGGLEQVAAREHARFHGFDDAGIAHWMSLSMFPIAGRRGLQRQSAQHPEGGRATRAASRTGFARSRRAKDYNSVTSPFCDRMAVCNAAQSD